MSIILGHISSDHHFPLQLMDEIVVNYKPKSDEASIKYGILSVNQKIQKFLDINELAIHVKQNVQRYMTDFVF